MNKGKLSKVNSHEEEKKVEEEPNLLNTQPKLGDMIRLPNTSPSNQIPGQRDGYASPTRILENIANQPVLENFRTISSDEIFMEYEGEMMRKTPEGKFKRYWFCLLSKELYCYRKKEDEKHKGMHSLVGVYIK